MNRKESKFITIAEDYIKYFSKSDHFNKWKMHILFKMDFSVGWSNIQYFVIGDEKFYYKYSNKKKKYIIIKIEHIKGIKDKDIRELEKRKDFFEKKNRREYER